MSNKKPENWVLHTREKSEEKEAQRVFEFCPLLPEWKRGMCVADRWEDFSAEQWRSAIRSAQKNEIPHGESTRLLDEVRLVNDGEALYRLSVRRWGGTENNPPNFQISIQFCHPLHWYYHDQEDFDTHLRAGEAISYNKREYKPNVGNDFGEFRVALPVAPFDVQKEKDLLEHDAVFRKVLSLDRLEYFADDFERDIDELLRKKRDQKEHIDFQKTIDLSWEQAEDLSLVCAVIQPMISEVEALWTTLIAQNVSDGYDKKSLATLGATIAKPGYLSSEPVDLFFQARAADYFGPIDDVLEQESDVISLDERRKIPLVHSDPEYWQARWKREVDSFAKSGFWEPLQHAQFGPMLCRLAERAVQEIIPDVRTRITNSYICIERDLTIPSLKIEHLDRREGLTRIAGQMMNSSTNYPILQDSHAGSVYLIPIIDGKEMTWNNVHTIPANGIRVRLRMDIHTDPYANHDIPKAFAKVAAYYHALIDEGIPKQFNSSSFDR